MKKTVILSALGAFLTVPTFGAVQRCVALNNSTTCATVLPEDYASVWDSSCTTNGKYVPIKGVAMCGAEEGLLGEIAETVSIGDNDAGSCWCKTISPAISRWVAVGSETSDTGVYGCGMKCAYDCARFMAEDSYFRKIIISTMGGQN